MPVTGNGSVWVATNLGSTTKYLGGAYPRTNSRMQINEGRRRDGNRRPGLEADVCGLPGKYRSAAKR